MWLQNLCMISEFRDFLFCEFLVMLCYPTMFNFCPIMLYLPTYLKSDVINGHYLLQLNITTFYYRFPGVAIKLDTASVYSTKCSCIQRLAGRCKHIACVLYLLEEVGQGEKPKLMETPTDVGCYWNKGAISNKNPGPIGNHLEVLKYTHSVL